MGFGVTMSNFSSATDPIESEPQRADFLINVLYCYNYSPTPKMIDAANVDAAKGDPALPSHLPVCSCRRCMYADDTYTLAGWR